MPRRDRVPVPLGAGLDRATGAAAVDPRTLQTGRNLVAREASVALRPGFQSTGLTAYDPAEATNVASDILCTVGMQATKDVLQVTYDQSTRKVIVWRLNPNGGAKQFVALWGTLNASAQFPVITAAESYGKMFFAHAEPTLTFRLATAYYTPNATDAVVGSWSTLVADLNGDSSNGNVYFYAVAAHGPYLAGCGYGEETSSTTQDRPEIVRLSVGADPTTFRPETYFLCGPRGERIEGMLSMTDGLAALGARMRHVIYGDSPANFGVKIADPNFGMTSPRAGVVVGATAYTWSAQGPRRIDSALAASTDVAIPLDVFGAQPSGTPDSGPDRLRFAAYDPVNRLLYFMSPNPSASPTTTFGYIGSLRNPDALRFTDCVFSRHVLSAGVYYTGKVTPAAGVGYAASTTATDGGWSGTYSGRSVTVAWTNTSATGTETVEIWQKAAGGSWSIVRTVALSGTSQNTVLTGLDPLTAYSFGVRFATATGGYTTGYTGADPDAWSAGTAAGSKASVTTGAGAPTTVVVSWARTSATTTGAVVAVSWVDQRCTLEIEKNNGAGWVNIYTGTPAGTDWTVNYDVPSAEYNTSVSFRARLTKGANSSAYSGTASRVMGVTDTLPSVTYVFDRSGSDGTTKRTLELWGAFGSTTFQWYEQETTNSYSETQTYPIGAMARTVQSTQTGVGNMTLRARAAVTAYGVTDYGPYSAYLTTVVCDPGSSDPSTPDPAAFYTPAGNMADQPFGSRTRPRTITPQDLPNSNYSLFLVWQIAFGSGADFGPTVVPYTRNLLATSVGGSGSFFYAWAIRTDTSSGNLRRSAIFDVVT